MRKIIFTVLSTALICLGSCKKDEPEPYQGKVYLVPDYVEMNYGDKEILEPKFSEDGLAKQKSYGWKSDSKEIISYQVLTGNKAEITAKKLGKANVTIYSLDGKIQGKCGIFVKSRTNFLSGYSFKPGISKENLINSATGELNKTESTDNLLVYDIKHDKIKQDIYYFNNNKLHSRLIIMENTAENQLEAEQFIEERFNKLNFSTSDGIVYYDASSYNDDYPDGTAIGIFLPESETYPEKVKDKLGVKYILRNNLPN